MFAPATLPCSCAIGLAPATGMSAAETWATVKASFLTSVAPVTPVTTTWLRRLMSRLSWKSVSIVPPESVMRCVTAV